jgi:hypothetical protein
MTGMEPLRTGIGGGTARGSIVGTEQFKSLGRC